MSIDKQALRGQNVDANFYLAECCNCGQVMPSSKLIESRNYPDGDADCYCPHCNADDCDINDMGSSASEAWNYQQKRIEALLDDLDGKDGRINELDSQRALAFMACNRWRDKCVDAEAKLEAAEKRIDALSASHSKLHEGMAAIYNAICADGASTSLSAILTFVKRAFEESRAAAGITVKGE
ncbi:ead/Ea22-like family protein [Lelliottia amnigena]|uniref:ead/Ea22-like family protein n=1 Tax=Lelliottia amnigena TaxID=61646 RepID=UPI001C5CA7C7|nr:ead/Ea22-like family protein [Lelliottia amnigena]QXZ19098.1 ead/Ea22-like family protein [Lelliottia amnigena]